MEIAVLIGVLVLCVYAVASYQHYNDSNKRKKTKRKL